EALLGATLKPLQSGLPIAGETLDRTLLLLSDVPGVTANAVLMPGTAVGTSNLNITAMRTTATFAGLTLDDYGNKYVGRTRLSGSAGVVNPFHHGDILSATFVTTGNRMNFGRVSYDTLLTGSG